MFKVIAVDDEQSALNRFSRVIAEEKRISLVATFTHANEALDYATNNHIDIAFLDVEMPSMTGLELSEKLQEINPFIEIIFVTAYNQYALQAFQAHAIGYLLKPIQEEELTKQIDILYRKLDRTPKKEATDLLTVRCLGPLSIYAGNDINNAIRFRTSKAEELFTLFIQYEGKPRSKDSILDMLWPDTDIEKASNNFRVTCTYIRGALSDFGFTDILLRDKDNYMINTSKIHCDLYDFKKAYDNLSTLSLLSLSEAFNMYQGVFLENCFFEWTTQTKQWLEKCYKKMGYRLADLYVESKNYNLACDTLAAIYNIDVYEEDAVIKAIKIRLSQNDILHAKSIYLDYSTILRLEDNVEPSPQIFALIKNC